MKKLMIVRSKSALAGLAFALAATVTSRAAVIYVPADYPTIQAAVDALPAMKFGSRPGPTPNRS